MKAILLAGGVLIGLTGTSTAADLGTAVPTAPVVAAPAGVALGAPIMVSPVRSGFSRRIQTHVIAQPAGNPRAIFEGPTFSSAPPVIIVVKPSGR